MWGYGYVYGARYLVGEIEGDDPMNLIESLEDERLDIKKSPTFPANIVGVRQAIGDIMILRDSLRASLTREAALRERAEAAEAQLCAAREAIKRNVVDAPDLHATNMNEAYLASLELQRRKEALAGIFSSSSPCPHEEEAKLLKEKLREHGLE